MLAGELIEEGEEMREGGDAEEEDEEKEDEDAVNDSKTPPPPQMLSLRPQPPLALLLPLALKLDSEEVPVELSDWASLGADDVSNGKGGVSWRSDGSGGVGGG